MWHIGFMKCHVLHIKLRDQGFFYGDETRLQSDHNASVTVYHCLVSM